MRQIDENTTSIIVWLGKPENEVNNRLGFKKMRKFEVRYRKMMLKSRLYRPWWWPNKVRTQEEDIYSLLFQPRAWIKRYLMFRDQIHTRVRIIGFPYFALPKR